MPTTANGPVWTDIATFALAAAVFVVTVWNILYVRIQTRNLQTQTDLLSRAIQLTQNEQRAWLGVTAIRANWDVLPPIITLVLTNRGNSPALKVRHEVRLITKPLDDPFCCDDVANAELIPKGSTTTILPGESYNIGPGITDDRGKEVIEALQSGDRAVYIFGWVEYQDVFEKCHRTTFARYALLAVPGWAHTDFYNEMD